jgi:hypothetical protein
MIVTPEVEPLAAPWRARPSRAFVAEVVAVAGTHVGRPAIIAVDGRQGSGKTTVAGRLAALTPGTAVVHSDDVAWWEAFFDWEQLMITGVLEPVRRGEAVDFRPPAWEARGRQGSIVVPSGAPLVVLEGVGTSRRSLMPYIDGAIWVQSDLAESRRRGLERDGDKQSDVDLWDEWENEEQPFLAEDRPWERAAAIVCGTPRLTGIDFDESTEVLVGRSLRA